MLYLMTLPVFLGNIRGAQLIIIVLVILLLFGGKKIPELMRGLGKGVHAFRQGIQEAKEEMEKPIEKTGEKKQINENQNSDNKE